MTCSIVRCLTRFHVNTDISQRKLCDTGEVGSCGSRAGSSICAATDDGPMCVFLDSSPPPVTVSIYGQCGGANYDGPTECDAGLVCATVNEFYSNCVRDDAAVGVGLWEQCGGEGYDGATNCLVGASCVEVNQWYSQCQP